MIAANIAHDKEKTYHLLVAKEGSKRRVSQIPYRKNSLYNAIETLQVACSPPSQVAGSIKNHYLVQDVESESSAKKDTKSSRKNNNNSKTQEVQGNIYNLIFDNYGYTQRYEHNNENHNNDDEKLSKHSNIKNLNKQEQLLENEIKMLGSLLSNTTYKLARNKVDDSNANSFNNDNTSFDNNNKHALLLSLSKNNNTAMDEKKKTTTTTTMI